jgi:signal transduction histidine kinase
MALAHIDRGAEIMLALINDLLDVSAIESGKLTLHAERLDLKSYLLSCHESNALLAQGKNIALKLELDPGLAEISIDPERMNQVIGNLVGNAIKYSFPGTSTLLRAAMVENEVQIAIIDQGQGIPAADIPKLFQDFGKASVRPTGGEKSTGLGLAICRRIVEAHKGRIWCESEVGKGSTFTVAIPVA